MRYFLARLKEKNNWLENLREFSKTFKRILKKIAKMHYFSIIFKRSSKNALFFAGMYEKRKLLGNFEKIMKSINANSIEKLNF